MHRSRVVDPGADPGGPQPIAQLITLVEADHVLVEDMSGVRTADGKRERQARQTSIVASGDRLPSCVVREQPVELDPEDRRLDRIETRVDANPGTNIAITPAILANFTQRAGERGVAGYGHTAIPERSQILCRVEAEAGNVANRARRPPAPLRAMALRAILDQTQAVPAGDLGKSGQIGRLTIEMHRQHRRGPARRWHAQCP